MARRPIPSLAADFENVRAFLQERGILGRTPTALTIDNAKRIHRATHSLILWRFRLGKVLDHGGAFIEEIASDALQILPQVLTGYSKTPKLLMRGILENTLRHIYFSDHPVEFARMNRAEKWYLSMEDLLEYAKAHPDIERAESRFDALCRMKGLYGELSAGIHGRRVSDLEMRVALEKITYDEELAAKQTVLVERCAEASNFLLTVYQRVRFGLFGLEDRRVILRTMNAGARSTWKELDS
jgi:hypothetical protein